MDLDNKRELKSNEVFCEWPSIKIKGETYVLDEDLALIYILVGLGVYSLIIGVISSFVSEELELMLGLLVPPLMLFPILMTSRWVYLWLSGYSIVYKPEILVSFSPNPLSALSFLLISSMGCLIIGSLGVLIGVYANIYMLVFLIFLVPLYLLGLVIRRRNRKRLDFIDKLKT